MYHAARPLYGRLGSRPANSGYLDSYFTAEVRLDRLPRGPRRRIHWNTDVVPAFGLDRPIVERTRLWFADDVHRPFRRSQVDTTVISRDADGYPTRWPAPDAAVAN